jgi:hypothetical protein
MSNPIPKSNLWATPKDLNDLYALLEVYTGEHAAVAMHVAMLTLNTCHNLVQKELDKTPA